MQPLPPPTLTSSHALCHCRALAINPGQPGTYSAFGYTNHLMGNLQEAVENYHSSLALKPDDAFTVEMLTIALQEYAGME